MLILFLTGFGVFCDVFPGSQADTACHGGAIKLPSFLFSSYLSYSVYFIPSNGGPEKLVMNNGKPKDPRIKCYNTSFYLTNLTKEDDGYFSHQSLPHSLQFKISVSDCVEKFYMDELEYKVSTEAQYLEFTPQINHDDKPIILWNRTDLQGNDDRRGTIMNNVWRISNLTQADSGYYSFRQNNNTLESRVHLTVKEKSSNNDTNQNKHTTITYPWDLGSWSDTMWPKNKNEHETALREDQQSWEDNSLFNAQSNGTEDDDVTYTAPQTWDTSGPKTVFKILKYSSIAMCVFVIIAYCCKKCLTCNSKDSASQTEEVLVVTYCNENPPTGRRCSAPAYSPVFPHQPDGITVNPPQPGINVNPPQPGITVNPPQPGINVNPPQPGINVNPPHNGISVNPPHPGINVSLLQPEVTAPVGLGSTAAPTFSLDFLSSGDKSRFELKEASFSSEPLLSSETPSCDVYNSDKLNFL